MKLICDANGNYIRMSEARIVEVDDKDWIDAQNFKAVDEVLDDLFDTGTPVSDLLTPPVTFAEAFEAASHHAAVA